MATSTSTTFTASPDGPQITVEQRVSQSVARRALKQIEAVKQQPNAPALAAPGGLVQRPGGEPLRPRANQSTGATPVGNPVGFSEGILTGQPLVGGEVAGESLPVGWQVGEGDPAVVGVVARYPEDRYLDEATLTLYYWQQLPGEAAAWVPLLSGAEILVLDAAPTEPPDSSKAVAFVRDPKEAYVWDALAATPAWLGPYGGGGGSGGVGLVLVSSTLDLTVPSSTFSSPPLDFAAQGFTELIDNQGYYDSANSTRITFSQAGAYRCTFKAVFGNANNLNPSNWFVTMRLSGGEFDSVVWANPKIEFSPLDSANYKELVFYLQTNAGEHAELGILQVNNDGTNQFVYPQNKAFFTVEKIA